MCIVHCVSAIVYINDILEADALTYSTTVITMPPTVKFTLPLVYSVVTVVSVVHGSFHCTGALVCIT
jgi:hypothetical protein